MLDAALVYEEDGRYLALPVSAVRRPSAVRWLESGV